MKHKREVTLVSVYHNLGAAALVCRLRHGMSAVRRFWDWNAIVRIST